MATQTTVTIDKGDILGAVLAAIPGAVGLGVIAAIFVSSMMGETIRPKEVVGPLVVLGLLSLAGWGMWEFGHWFTR